jgi:hypothetical protein
MRRSIHTEERYHSPHASVRPRVAAQVSCSTLSMGTCDINTRKRNPLRRTSSDRSRDLDGAGCHLQMMSSRNRSFDHQFEDSQPQLPPALVDSSGSESENMVWKRGPNGAWGRFPDDSKSVSTAEGLTFDENDEDAQLAEALRRSLQQM